MTSIPDRIDEVLHRKGLYEIGVEILQKYNLRISELMSISRENFFPDRMQVIAGKKKSNPIIIRDTIILQKLEKLFSEKGNQPFRNITYWKWYRYIGDNYGHMIQQVRKKKNRKVTHVFRYFALVGVEDPKTQKTILHHNSQKSNHYYTHKIKEKQNGNN